MDCYLKDKNKPSLLFHFDNHLLKRTIVLVQLSERTNKKQITESVVKTTMVFPELDLGGVERKNCLKSRQKDFLLLSCCLESMNSVHIQNISNHIDFLSSHHLCQTIQQGQLQSEVTFLFPLSTSSVVTANVLSSNTHLLCVCFHNHILWIKPILCGLP